MKIVTRNKDWGDGVQRLLDQGYSEEVAAIPMRLDNKFLDIINPFSVLLTHHEKAMIREEIQGNVWYFAREMFKFEKPGMSESFNLKMNSLMLGHLHSYSTGSNAWLSSPRQTGRSLPQAIEASHCLLTKGSLSFVDGTPEMRTMRTERMVNQLLLLPYWLTKHIRVQTTGSAYTLDEMSLVGSRNGQHCMDEPIISMTGPNAKVTFHVGYKTQLENIAEATKNDTVILDDCEFREATMALLKSRNGKNRTVAATTSWEPYFHDTTKAHEALMDFFESAQLWAPASLVKSDKVGAGWVVKYYKHLGGEKLLMSGALDKWKK